jgi:hypothetical protein
MPNQNLAIICIALAAAAVPALAVEGAVGRTVPGMWVMPQGAVVNPKTGFSFTIMPIGYSGALGGSRQTEIGGVIVANASVGTNVNLLIPQYVYNTHTPKVSFSSSFVAPVNFLGVNADLQVRNQALSVRNSNAGLGDVFFSPLTAGIHFSETNNLAVSTMIFAPTGHYRLSNLSNLGMNAWTFMPNFAHTILWEKRGLELDNFVGFDIYTTNQLSNYKSGTMFHWDGMIIQYLSKRFGFGAIVSNLTQITKDSGGAAPLLNGFQGGAWGAGPMILYVMKPKDPGITFQFRYVPEFHATNLMKGYTLLLGMTFQVGGSH